MNIRTLDGIFITHEHRDHITGAGIVARRFKADIYATPLTWRYFLRHKNLGALDERQAKTIQPHKPIILGNAEIMAFDIPHDASQPVGYTFCEKCAASQATKKMAIATDLGHATDEIANFLKNSRILVLESNHDPEMLQRGRYHPQLKIRVAGNHGHLSNAQAGTLLCQTVVPNHTHVFLAHLSEENNTPMLAFDTVKRILDANDVSAAHLEVAERNIAGGMISY